MAVPEKVPSTRSSANKMFYISRIPLDEPSLADGNVPSPSISDLSSLGRHLPSICSNIFQQIGSQQTEGTYQRCLATDLEICGVQEVLMEPEIALTYKGRVVGTRRPDLLLTLKSGETAIIELKAVSEMDISHMKQLEYYLHHCNVERGYLINFSHDSMFPAVDDKSSFRVVYLHGLMDKIKHLLIRGPSLRLRNSPKKREVEVLEVSAHQMDDKERSQATQQNDTQPEMIRFGITQKGTPCKICIKEQQFCRLHKDQEA